MKTYLTTSNGMGMIDSAWIKGAKTANNPKVKALVAKGWTYVSSSYDREERTWSAVVELWEPITK